MVEAYCSNALVQTQWQAEIFAAVQEADNAGDLGAGSSCHTSKLVGGSRPFRLLQTQTLLDVASQSRSKDSHGKKEFLLAYRHVRVVGGEEDIPYLHSRYD